MAVKRLNRKALVAHLHNKIEQPVPGLTALRSEVIRAIYSGLLDAVERGDFDYPDQPTDPKTGRFKSSYFVRLQREIDEIDATKG